jgi:hypothetical protein
MTGEAEKLFASRPEGQSFSCRRLTCLADDVELRLVTPAWQAEDAPREAEFILRITSVAEQHIEPQLLAESGLAFQLTADHPLLLDYGPRSSIFGQAPLPDPYRFFLEFHKLVRDTWKIPRDPVKYLNWQGSLSDWLVMVYSRSFNLLSAPVPIAEACRELLDAQVADYILLPDKPQPQLARQVVILGHSWWIGNAVEILESSLISDR